MNAEPAKNTEKPGKGQAEAEVTEVPKDPKNTAGSINPKEKGPFYEAVLKRQAKRKGN